MPPLRTDVRRYMRWAAVLEALEQDVERAEAQADALPVGMDDDAVAGDLSADLPSVEEMGPMPEIFAARAATLAQRQTEAITRAQDKLAALRRQIKLNQDLKVEAEPAPIYLDTTG